MWLSRQSGRLQLGLAAGSTGCPLGLSCGFSSRARSSSGFAFLLSSSSSSASTTCVSLTHNNAGAARSYALPPVAHQQLSPFLSTPSFPSSSSSSTSSSLSSTPSSSSPSQDNLLTEINEYSKRAQTPISLKQFVLFGKQVTSEHEKNEAALRSCEFLRRELPVRLAHMHREFDVLPAELRQTTSVELVRKWYEHSFREVLRNKQEAELAREKRKNMTAEEQCSEEEKEIAEFGKLLQQTLERHAPVVTTMARGVLEVKEKLGEDFLYETSLQHFLDRFYMNRIGIRMLIQQHLGIIKDRLHIRQNGKAKEGAKVSPSIRWVGEIDRQCDVRLITEDAGENAMLLCQTNYGVTPKVKVITPGDDHPTFPYVPSHLYHICFELLKNSIRAVVEQHYLSHKVENEDDLPPIRVVIVKGGEDMTIKISDEGGGIPRNAVNHLFSYHYTTAQLPSSSTDSPAGTDMNSAPMAGFGYGIPLSRLYARYFGGDLQIVSMEGFGTDAYVHLRVAGDTAEVLPIFDSKAKGFSNHAGFWSSEFRPAM
ncbi:[Pyruvate dehydrogenase (acetyl-transferring)] kinase isozyme 2 [Balamuthia mandrillaris]